MFHSSGKLVYSDDGRRVVVEVDPEIARYYRSLIPKSIKWQVPLYTPHITVVRTGLEGIYDKSLWGHCNGEVIRFNYDPYICIGNKYIWLDAHSSRLTEIRGDLGLPRKRIPHPLGTGVPCFHITIANMKF